MFPSHTLKKSGDRISQGRDFANYLREKLKCQRGREEKPAGSRVAQTEDRHLSCLPFHSIFQQHAHYSAY